jgi:carbon-monoxide dehydrogenase large subunit
MDTYGSRSLVVGGEALVKAADKVIEKAKSVAAHLLEASVDDIEFSAGRFSVRGTDQGMAIGEIAGAVFSAHNLPDDQCLLIKPWTRCRRMFR